MAALLQTMDRTIKLVELIDDNRATLYGALLNSPDARAAMMRTIR